MYYVSSHPCLRPSHMYSHSGVDKITSFGKLRQESGESSSSLNHILEMLSCIPISIAKGFRHQYFSEPYVPGGQTALAVSSFDLCQAKGY